MPRPRSVAPLPPAALPPGFSARLLAQARGVDAARGERVFRAGERPRVLYFVRAGEVRLERTLPDGAVLVLQRTAFGPLAPASLSSPRYHCDAVCARDSALVAVPSALLRAEIDRNAATRWAWIALLDRELREARAQVERLGLRTVRERLLHYVAERGRDGVLELAGTKRELAAELGVTHEALYRLLAELRASGEATLGRARIALRPRSKR
jgi:CRP-like cAMP-binding protein